MGAHKAAQHKAREEDKRNTAAADSTTELARAQAVAATQVEGLGQVEATSNANRQDIYDAAVALFESNQQAKATARERDEMWNKASQDAHLQQQQGQQQQQQQRGDVRRGRRKTRVRVGDAWFDLG